ncbi:RHS repeat-associated core domain-containing protein [Dentiradicibacter hellwigii]|uniref:RHS repeat-associated core domain-containing protein n=1 Tax=Dentiradicibacter hellwigii TaxID=3149053 RepID=A0ABV4UEL8_9RHOO
MRQFDAHGRPAYTSIYRYDPFGRRLSQTVIAYETTTTQTARPGEETRPARQTRTETSAPIINEQTAYGRDGDLQETQTLQASQAPQALQSSHRQTMQTAQAPQTPPAPTETTRTTYYGWDGDHLVQIKSPTGTTHIVYEDEYSFTPLIELYQPACAQPEEQSEAQEAIARVMNSLAQLGSEEVRELQQQIKAQAESILRQGGLREEEDEGEREGKHEGEGKHARASNALQIRYFHCNQIGAPLALTDDKGQVIWAARYDPWGNIEEAFNADPEHFEQTLRLPGQQHDKATGLYYNRHRFYDPRLGAYISQDPIGLDGGINLSSYVRNPVQWMDPWGLQNIPTQADNIRDTMINAAGVAAKLPNATAAVTVPANAAPAAASGLQSIVKNDFIHYQATGEHKMPDRTILGKCVNQMDWNQYQNFEDAWEALGKRCNINIGVLK